MWDSTLYFFSYQLSCLPCLIEIDKEEKFVVGHEQINLSVSRNQDKPINVLPAEKVTKSETNFDENCRLIYSTATRLDANRKKIFSVYIFVTENFRWFSPLDILSHRTSGAIF